MSAGGLRVAHQADVPPPARDGHVHAPVFRQKAHLTPRVGAHERDHDRLLLAPLEAIHCTHFEGMTFPRRRRHLPLLRKLET